jgi:hypothetical protein
MSLSHYMPPLRYMFGAAAFYYGALQVVSGAVTFSEVNKGKDMVSYVDASLKSGMMNSGEKLDGFGKSFLRLSYPGVISGQYIAQHMK